MIHNCYMLSSNSNCIIAGDTNINLLKINERTKFQEYFDIFTTNGLFPKITLPTRYDLNRIFSMSVFLCERNPTVTGGFPHQGQWRATSTFSLICAWTNGWANNQDAGGVRRHGAHYDVTVMVCIVDEAQYPNSSEWVNEWLSLMVFLVQRGACNSYKPCNHDL